MLEKHLIFKQLMEIQIESLSSISVQSYTSFVSGLYAGA